MKSEGLSESDLTIEIRKDNKVVYALNENKKMVPASVTKILTSYAVLQQIPLNHKFKTEMFFDGKNIYVKGGGDPSFVSENMWYLVNEFKRQNISVISGDIVLDDSLFDQVRYDESRESKRIDRSYDAPVGALSFNWNSVNIYVRPDNQKVKAIVDPESTYFSLTNSAKIVTGRAAKDLIISVNQDKRIIQVSGELLSKATEKAYYKNVSEPVYWFGENLKAFLKQRGITVQGKVKSGLVPKVAYSVATVESKNLSDILKDMNKFSNNFVAEMLTKNLAANTGESPARLSTGVDLIKKELSKIKITENEMTLINPSGFSRDNKFSAHVLTEVLNQIRNNFKIYPSFVESLPQAGLDGTLKKRMKNSVAEGYVRAKTGYLDGVISLAGYASRQEINLSDISPDNYVFSFIYNGSKDEAVVRSAFDKILIQILK